MTSAPKATKAARRRSAASKKPSIPKPSKNAERREALSAGFAGVGRAFKVIGSPPDELDDPAFIAKHPWVEDLADGIRFWSTQTCQVHLEDHLNVFVSIPDDLDDLDQWPSLTHIIEATAGAVRRLEQRQQQVVLEARRQGITWTEIGRALGTTRQSAWARYSGEE